MTDNGRLGERLVGSLRILDGKGVVRMEDVYRTDIEDLWSALTEPHRLARWIADVQGALQVGGEIRATFTSGWDGPGRVDACDRPHFLQVTFLPGQQEETVLDAHLIAESDRLTRLVVEERGLLLDELAAHGAGWQAHVEDLREYLAGHSRLDLPKRWAELSPAYQDLARQL
jgi:uncharacterized protein YndB with AHSA1/START domain